MSDAVSASADAVSASADAAAASAAPAPPDWFTAALAQAPVREVVDVAGCAIATERWEGGAGVPLVLLHGGAANTGWWRGLAPALARDRRVVAMDLSGHGSSGRRPRYGFPCWAEEALAVADLVAGGPAVLVGHSMGGIVVAVAAAMSPHRLAGVVVVDTPLQAPKQPRIAQAERAFRRTRRYATEADARRNFRLLPDQPVLHPALLEAAADASIVQLEDGWSWRFDPAVFATPAADRPPDLGVTLEGLQVPVATVAGAASQIAVPAERERLEQLGQRRSHRHREIAGAHHHLMFDQPLVLLEVLRELVDDLTGVDVEGASHG